MNTEPNTSIRKQLTVADLIAIRDKLKAAPLPRFRDIEVFVNDNACVYTELRQYKFPKSKKVRIRKKWRSNSKYFRFEKVTRIFMYNNKMYMSTKDFETLKNRNNNAIK
jgi:hypothetical protein